MSEEKKKNIWVIGIETGFYDQGEVDWKSGEVIEEEVPKTLVQICPIEGSYLECEVFTRPIEELDFWISKIGKEVDIEGVEKGFNEETGNPIWDTDLIKKRLEKT